MKGGFFSNFSLKIRYLSGEGAGQEWQLTEILQVLVVPEELAQNQPIPKSIADSVAEPLKVAEGQLLLSPRRSRRKTICLSRPPRSSTGAALRLWSQHDYVKDNGLACDVFTKRRQGGANPSREALRGCFSHALGYLRPPAWQSPPAMTPTPLYPRASPSRVRSCHGLMYLFRQ